MSKSPIDQRTSAIQSRTVARRPGRLRARLSWGRTTGRRQRRHRRGARRPTKSSENRLTNATLRGHDNPDSRG
jgi:hypothetical protein